MRDDKVVYAMLTQGRSIFMLRTRAHMISPNHDSDISLTNVLRYELKPMIRLEVYSNRHPSDLYKGYPLVVSHLVNLMRELIRDGISNFYSTTDASSPVILICYATSNGMGHNF